MRGARRACGTLSRAQERAERVASPAWVEPPVRAERPEPAFRMRAPMSRQARASLLLPWLVVVVATACGDDGAERVVPGPGLGGASASAGSGGAPDPSCPAPVPQDGLACGAVRVCDYRAASNNPCLVERAVCDGRVWRSSQAMRADCYPPVQVACGIAPPVSGTDCGRDSFGVCTYDDPPGCRAICALGSWSVSGCSGGVGGAGGEPGVSGAAGRQDNAGAAGAGATEIAGAPGVAGAGGMAGVAGQP